jgi:HEAT repeat protein
LSKTKKLPNRAATKSSGASPKGTEKERVKALAKIPTEIPTLSRWLGDDPKPRLEEVKGLVQKAGKERFARIADPYRIAIAWAWDENPETFFKLMNGWLSSDNPRLRQIAAGAMPLANEDYYAKSVKILKKLMTDGTREVRLTAIDVLAEDIDAHIELVKKWAKDEDSKVRETIARHLHLTEAPRKILPILEGLALDKDRDVHWRAASTLYDIYAVDPKGALEVAKKMAGHEDQDIRLAASLCFFEHVFADSFDHLFLLMRQWVRSGDPNLRWTLAHSLRFAKANPRSFQVLRALFEDRDPEIRRRVVWQLAEFFKKFEDPRLAAELLRRALKDQAKRVRDMAEESERNLMIDLATIAPPPIDGEEGEVPEGGWGPVEEEDEPAAAAEGEAGGKDDDEDDDF